MLKGDIKMTVFHSFVSFCVFTRVQGVCLDQHFCVTQFMLNSKSNSSSRSVIF